MDKKRLNNDDARHQKLKCRKNAESAVSDDICAVGANHGTRFVSKMQPTNCGILRVASGARKKGQKPSTCCSVCAT
eukprot:6191932-Pleurochrysis_carterae.AAC.3